MSALKTTTEFVKEAIAVHEGKYAYPDEYLGAWVALRITCPSHGDFYQMPHNHLHGRGCTACKNEIVGGNKRKTLAQFIVEARVSHGETYDYSKVDYKNTDTPVVIGCPIHGDFLQKPDSHVRLRCNCPLCAAEALGKNRIYSAAAFEKKARGVHGGKYDYSMVAYDHARKPVVIGCRAHGPFSITPNKHLAGGGCQICSAALRILGQSDTLKIFIQKAVAVHEANYDYSKVTYTKSTEKVEVVCRNHPGESFWVTPSNHVNNLSGCPKCANVGPSRAETEVFEFCKALAPDTVQSVRGLLDGRHELDIVIPSKNLAIEYNGLIWHSEKVGKDRAYHQRKSEQADLAGLRLIHIWQDEWRDKRAWCEAFLRMQLLGPDRKVYARQCDLRPVDTKTAQDFHDTYHLQGRRGGENFGVYLGGELLAVATVSQNELARWTVKFGVVIVGALSKVMKRVDREIISYCDTGKHEGAGYLKAGWELVGSSAPSYHYTDGQVRFNRLQYQKHKLVKAPGVSGTTEREMANSLGLYQIGGCRQLKFRWSA